MILRWISYILQYVRFRILTGVEGDLVVSGSLDLGRDTDELLPDGVLAAGVHHLLTDGRIIGRPKECRLMRRGLATGTFAGGQLSRDPPHDETQLVPLSLALVVLQVVYSPSALLLRKLLDESLPLLALLQGSLLYGGDALRVRSDSVDHKLVLLAELELIVGLEAGLVLRIHTR